MPHASPAITQHRAVVPRHHRHTLSWHTMAVSLGVLGMLCCGTDAPPPPEAPARHDHTLGEVGGVVHYDGHIAKSPAGAQLRGSCPKSSIDQVLSTIQPGGVAGAFVSLDVPALGQAPEPAAMQVFTSSLRLSLLIDHCRVLPRRAALPLGGQITITNLDHQQHLVFILHEKAVIASELLAPKNLMSWTPTASGLYHIGTVTEDAWVSAELFMGPTPHIAITDAAGRFEFRAVPPGPWELTVLHSVLGEIHRIVTLDPGQRASIDIGY